MWCLRQNKRRLIILKTYDKTALTYQFLTSYALTLGGDEVDKWDMKQRPIKFRAWDKKENRMCSVCDLNWVNDNIITHLPCARIDEKDPNWPWRTPGKEIELMQFTGLKDKNGKEIYEGDIVRTSNEAWSPYEVVCRPPTFYFDSISPNIKKYNTGMGHIASGDCEVIGNVHETPELLVHPTK